MNVVASVSTMCPPGRAALYPHVGWGTSKSTRRSSPKCSRLVSIWNDVDRQYSEGLLGGLSDEQRTSVGRNQEGRIRHHVGRKASEMGRHRAVLCWVGDVPPQGVARRSESCVCL